MSSIRSAVIEDFLTTVESDKTVPPALTAELRGLIAKTDKLPDAGQIAALVQVHTSTRSGLGGTA